MSEWQHIRLTEFADVLDSLRIPVNEEERDKKPGDTPYYGANGLQGYIDGWIFDEPLILIAEDGGYFDEYATRPVAYKIEGKSWVNNHAHILRPKDAFDFNFVFFSLQHKNITPFIKGGTRAKLNQKELKEIKIYAPKRKVLQEKIARILQTLDQSIEKTEALIDKYQQIKAGLMHDLFTRGIGADGKLRPPREQAPELYQETPIGWIPKEWKVKILEDLCSQIADCPHSTPIYRDTGIPCIRTADMEPGKLRLEQAYCVDDKDYRIRTQRMEPKQGDIIYSREGERLGIASPVGEEKVCLGQRVMILRPATYTDPNFLLWAMNHPEFYQRVVRGLGATTSPHVNVGEIKEMTVSVPMFEEQKLIGEKLRSIQFNIDSEVSIRQKLQGQKFGLMHDLLTGKVEVKAE